MQIVINKTMNNLFQLNRRKYNKFSPTSNTNVLNYQNNSDTLDLSTNSKSKKRENSAYSNMAFTGGIKPISIRKTKNLKPLFQDLINFKGDNIEFTKYAFGRLKKHFGYEDLIPADINMVNKAEDKNWGAGFNNKTGEFRMDRYTCLTLSRSELASVLRHEFEHLFQFERMFRTEDIGIEKVVKVEAQQIIKSIDSKFYIAGIKVDPRERDEFEINNYNLCLKDINMKFWNNIIHKKGIIKKDSVEAKLAHKEFEDFSNIKQFIDLTSVENEPDFPMFQKTKYYDSHNIESLYNYVINPLEIGARKAEKSFLKSYLEFSKMPYTPNPQIIKDEEISSAIKMFMLIFDKKFEGKITPERFRAYIYDRIVTEFLEEHSEKVTILDRIREVPRILESWTDQEFKDKLFYFKYFVEKNYIRLNSQEETENFINWANKFLNQ